MIVHAYYPVGETRVQREAEALVRAGFDVDVLCLRDEGERARERIDGIEVHRLPVQVDKRGLGRQFISYLRMLALASLRVAQLHRAQPFTSVQVHNLPDFLVFAAVYPKRRGARVVLDLHDLMPEFFDGRFGRQHPLLRRAVRWQERVSCHFADRVITVSDHWRQALIDRGVPSRKVDVVMNVADARLFTPGGAGQRPAPANRLRLLYHGTITRRYGLDLALRAVAIARDEVPGIHLTIVGKGDDVPALTALRTTLGLDLVVDIRDEFLPVEVLPDLIASADAGIVPYRDDVFTDGLLPTKLMEYAEMHLPSIAARTTAIDGYFADSFVEFFEPGDVGGLARIIVELARNPARREALARGAERFTERYNWADVSDRYVELVVRLDRSPLPATSV